MAGKGWLRAAGVVSLLLGLAACKPPQPALPEKPIVTLRLQPTTATLTTSHEIQFGYRLTNGGGLGITWRVVESDGGTVDPKGQYRAPGHPGTYTIEARPQADPAQAVRAQVTVVPPPVEGISAPASVAPRSKNMVASLPTQPDSSFAWSIQGGTLQEGADTHAVTFSAGEGPTVLLSCRVVNAAGDALTSSLELPVTQPRTLRIEPPSAILTVGRTLQFGYALEGTGESEVVWSLLSPEGGTLDAHGSYRAPATPGTYLLQVASAAHPSTVAQAQVKVVPEPLAMITAPEAVKAGATGLTAQVAEQANTSYYWEVLGGTATAGQSCPVLTFTVGEGPTLTLRCHVVNEAGDRFTRSLKLNVEP
jgi:hypothetical protein